jgi:RNA polymerase sigma factor (sigma-70 family)
VTAIALRGDVQAASNGDRAAFARLVDASRGLVCAIVLAIVRDVAASEDLAQEVFLTAWSGLKGLRNPDSFLPWLRQLARNRALDWTRSRKRAPETPDSERLLSAASDPADAPDRLLLGAEEQRVLAEAIDALPDDAREVVTLYYREGRSAAQVASLLEIREDAVKKRLSRAREALREATAKRLEEVLTRTVPTAAFTHAVMHGLPAGLPGVGAGAALGAGGKLAKVLALLGGGATLGGAGAIGGILWQRRTLLRAARDEEERRGIHRLALAQIGVVLAAVTGFLLVPRTPVAVYSVLFGYLIALFAMIYGWYPRIIARRLAAERAEDPGAAARQRRRRVYSVLGAISAAAVAMLATAWGLHHGS